MNTKISTAVIVIALALSGCVGTNTAAIPIDAADPCEYAKQVVVQADKAYRESLPDNAGLYIMSAGLIGLSKASKRRELEQARANMVALCKKDEKDDDKTWACAEGHSCR